MQSGHSQLYIRFRRASAARVPLQNSESTVQFNNSLLYVYYYEQHLFTTVLRAE